MCTIREIRICFQDKEHCPCPLTDRLVRAGYQQQDGEVLGCVEQKEMEK